MLLVAYVVLRACVLEKARYGCMFFFDCVHDVTYEWLIIMKDWTQETGGGT